MADWQKIREGYDRSTLDWTRLHTYARKVAAAKAQVDQASSWTLDTRYWHRKERNHGGGSVTESEIYRIQLRRDGSIVNQITKWTETDKPFWMSPEDVSVLSFTAEDALMFDFHNPEYRQGGVTTNRDSSGKLLVHAKGVGLSKRLKALMPDPVPLTFDV